MNEKRHFYLSLNTGLTSRGTLFLPGNPGHPVEPVRSGAAFRGSGIAAGVPFRGVRGRVAGAGLAVLRGEPPRSFPGNPRALSGRGWDAREERGIPRLEGWAGALFPFPVGRRESPPPIGSRMGCPGRPGDSHV